MRKPFREKFKVYKNVFEDFTIKSIIYLMNKQIITGLESPINIGKESNVFSGIRKYDNKEERVAIKIYRVGSSDFGKMLGYLKLDPRFNALGSKRQTISTWARREFRNLNKAYTSGVKCPNPIAVKNNVLVMEFIGNKDAEQNPISAPLLNQSHPKKPKEFFEQLKQQMRMLFQKAKLVHSDLSEFNILDYRSGGKDIPYLIDFSHALPVNAYAPYKEFLMRDAKNVSKFFSKLKVDTNTESLYNFIINKDRGLQTTIKN